MTALLVLPMSFALSGIQELRPTEPVESSFQAFPSENDRSTRPPGSGNPSPNGYTYSLLIWFIPAVVITYWIRVNKRDALLNRAILWTMLLVGCLGLLLDVVFGVLFFTFPNRDAILGPCLPAFTWGKYDEWIRWDLIPIEEFFFYFFGALAIVLIYVWCDQYWFSAYNHRDDSIRRSRIAKHIKWRNLHLPSALVGIFGFLVGFVYRLNLNQKEDVSGFPGYLLFLTLVGVLPSLLLFRFVQDLINYRALSFTLITVLCISIFYEVVLGVPYQWWGFRDEQMVGIPISAFSGVPIEEPFLWIAIVWACVIFFETIHTLQHIGWTRSRKTLFIRIIRTLRKVFS